MKFSRIASLVVLTLGLSAPLVAGNRAFVSGTGLDMGTCPITSPCRGFTYALSQVTSGGEIIALDTAGYGSVSIGFSVSILAAPGVTAFATATSGNVVTVAAGMSDVVTLRGLTVTGNGSTNGVVFTTGAALNLENCFVNGHVTGIEFARTADSSKPSVQVIHCIVANNLYGLDTSNAGALVIASDGRLRPMAVAPPPAQVYATVSDSAFLTNNYGIIARDDSNVTVVDTVISGNSAYGVYAIGSDGHASNVSLDRCTISRNSYGVAAGDLSGSQLAHGVISLAHCQITGNDNGVTNTTSGVTLSLISNSVVTNTILYNGFNGSPSSTYTAQ